MSARDTPDHWIRQVGAILWLMIFSMAAAHAHKASDSYVQIDAGETGMTVRWDIALRDLDAALDLDTNDDGKLTWAEVKAGWPRIQSYALPRLRIGGCPLHVTSTALERRNDGTYAVMFLASDCVLNAPPTIAYSLLREVDPTHRGIAKIQQSGQPLVVRLLDPVVDTASAAGPAGSAASTATSDNEPSQTIAPTGALGFLREGIRHILTGYDHVLFLLCLLLPSVMRRKTAPASTPAGITRAPARAWIKRLQRERGQERAGWRPVDRLAQAVWPVVGIVSAFTVAHSITLGLAATHVLSLSPAFIEPAIAVTIVLAALDNLWPIFPVPRIVVTFFFGLIHGFGFAGVLSELNLPTAQFALALLQFNVGLEMGQLLIVICVTALLFSLRRWSGYRLLVVQGGSVVAIVVAALWFIERVANVAIL